MCSFCLRSNINTEKKCSWNIRASLLLWGWVPSEILAWLIARGLKLTVRNFETGQVVSRAKRAQIPQIWPFLFSEFKKFYGKCDLNFEIHAIQCFFPSKWPFLQNQKSNEPKSKSPFYYKGAGLVICFSIETASIYCPISTFWQYFQWHLEETKFTNLVFIHTVWDLLVFLNFFVKLICQE